MTCLIRVDEKTLRGRLENCGEDVKRLIVLLDRSEISPVETAYLLYRGAARAALGETILDFEGFMRLYSKADSLAVPVLEVYIELRKRGRLPLPGPRRDTLLLIRSRRDPRPTHYILVLEEGRPVKVSALEWFVEEARRKNLEPVLAIVDRYGDVTFYTPMMLRLGREEVESLEAASST